MTDWRGEYRVAPCVECEGKGGYFLRHMLDEDGVIHEWLQCPKCTRTIELPDRAELMAEMAERAQKLDVLVRMVAKLTADDVPTIDNVHRLRGVLRSLLADMRVGSEWIGYEDRFYTGGDDD